jgi:hypothetical protein
LSCGEIGVKMCLRVRSSSPGEAADLHIFLADPWSTGWGQPTVVESGEAWQSSYAERLTRTIREEVTDLLDCDDYNSAIFQLGWFRNDAYIHKRIHASLGNLEPAELEDQWRREREQPPDVHQNRL